MFCRAAIYKLIVVLYKDAQTGFSAFVLYAIALKFLHPSIGVSSVNLEYFWALNYKSFFFGSLYNGV